MYPWGDTWDAAEVQQLVRYAVSGPQTLLSAVIHLEPVPMAAWIWQVMSGSGVRTGMCLIPGAHIRSTIQAALVSCGAVVGAATTTNSNLCAYRYPGTPSVYNSYFGFRLAR